MSSHPPAIPEPALTDHTRHVTGHTEHPTVAVIAIHGVGRHAPGSSAEALATLLASLGREDAAQRNPHAPPQNPAPYAGFDIRAIDVPVAAVATAKLVEMSAQVEGGRRRTTANDRHQKSMLAKIWGVFDERRGFLAERRIASAASVPASAKGAAPPPPPDGANFDYLYMLSQLADYHGEPDRTFSTFRYESRRAEPHPARPNHPAPRVHIYDAHYSDLSKPESSFVGFFFAFYQLLFHLAGIGLNGVYLAEAENTAPGSGPWPWRVFSWLHACAVRSLTMFVPILNLVFLCIGLSAFVDKFNPIAAYAIGYSLAAFLGLTATLLIRKYHRSPKRPLVWAVIPFVGAGVVICALQLLVLVGHTWISSMHSEKWLVLLNWLILAGVAIYFIARKFNEVRTGSSKIAIPLYVVNVIVFLFFLHRASGAVSNEAATAAFLTVQFVFGELSLCWVVCLLSALLSWPVSVACIASVTVPEEKCRAKAAHRTGRFAFAISASSF